MFNKKFKKSIITVIMSMALSFALMCSCGDANTQSQQAVETSATQNSNSESNETSTQSTESDAKVFDENTSEETADITPDAQEADNLSSESDNASGELLTGKHHVEISVKDYGTISLELDADIAPISVTNFVDLASNGFYDGLTFHRIITGFMIQGGDPLGNGTGGADTNIKGEFSANGIENNISHVRGAISMARSNDMDSASSQFFIVHEDSQFLDGQYAAFGMVTEGIEIVDQICEATPVLDNNGTVAPEKQPIIESIKVID